MYAPGLVIFPGSAPPSAPGRGPARLACRLRCRAGSRYRSTAALRCSSTHPQSKIRRLAVGIESGERRRKRHLFQVDLCHRGWADTGGAQLAQDFSAPVEPGLLEEEDILQRDGVALPTDDFGDVRDPPRAVSHARLLDDEVNRGGDLPPDGTLRVIDAGHQFQGLQPFT